MVTFQVITDDTLDESYVGTLFRAFEEKVKIGYDVNSVIDSIKSGQSVLVTCSDSTGYIGFLVLSEKETYENLELYVWAASALRPLLDEEIEQIMDVIRSIAQNIGASQITFNSYRNGWLRRAKKYGFEKLSVTYGVKV